MRNYFAGTDVFAYLLYSSRVAHGHGLVIRHAGAMAQGIRGAGAALIPNC